MNRSPQAPRSVFIEGRSLGRRKYEPATRGISLVPQGKRIYQNLTVKENILLGRASRRKGEWTVARLYELLSPTWSAPVIIDELVEAFRVIRENGTALVLVEQHIRIVQELTQRFVALGKGRVVAEWPVEDLQMRAVQELVAL